MKDSNPQKISRRELREKRINDLFDSCRDEVLKQIIGPFGLSPAMFADMDGGNVTTTHNFENGVVATEEDRQRYDQFKKNVESPIDRKEYDKDLPGKRKKMFQNQKPIESAWTGNELPRDGQTHLDHVRSAERNERNPRANLFMTKEERVAMANAPENLVPSESNINQSMGQKDKEDWANRQNRKDKTKTNAEHFGVDMEKLNKAKNTSDKHINKEVLKAQVMKQGTELLSTGAEEAGKNALKQAIGILMYELVNGSYVEVKRISEDPNLKENFVDHLIEGLKNLATRIQSKLDKIFAALASGGIQGFISNFLTYIINNVIKTCAKVVTIIREGITGLWEALKIVVNPPEGMSNIEVARHATKIIAAVITASLGLWFEKSVEGFILSIPFLVPFSSVISPAVTAFLTGTMTALVIYAIESLFDWLESSGTEKIESQILSIEVSAQLLDSSAHMLDIQFKNSKNYQICIDQYQVIEANLVLSASNLDSAIIFGSNSIDIKNRILNTFNSKWPVIANNDNELIGLIENYQLGE